MTRWQNLTCDGDEGTMAATADERERFGRRLRELREQRGLTARQLGEALSEPVSGQNVSGWERGLYAPQRRAVVAELEATLGTEPGDLGSLLGYGDLDGIDERFADFEGRLSRLESQIEKLLRRRRGVAE